MSRARSPNYPYFDFEEAVNKIRQIFESEKMNPGSREVVAKAMGYSGLSGASSKAIGALNSYELLEGRGSEYKISKAGIDILMAPKDSSERNEAIKKCAYSPPLFGQLKDRYGTNPNDYPSDESFHHFLVTNKFTLDAAKLATEAFRKTSEYVCRETGADDSDITPKNNNIDSLAENENINSNIQSPQIPVEELEFQNETMVFRISKDCKVSVVFEGEVSEQAIDKLIKHLNLAKEIYE